MWWGWLFGCLGWGSGAAPSVEQVSERDGGDADAAVASDASSAPVASDGLRLVAGEPVAARFPPGARHLVLVIGCTVRRDQVGAYGGPPGLTPHLDALAASGVIVMDPVAAAPWTRPAATALLTGRHAVELGTEGPQGGDRRLPAEAWTLAEHLQHTGYRTVGGTTNPNVGSVFGFADGFEVYLEPERLWREGARSLAGDVLRDAALQYIGTPDGAPLYLQLTLVDAHAPYPAPDPRWVQPGEPAEVGAYRAALHALDAQIGGLREALAARGFGDDNTVFVVVSDHGEGLGWPAHHGAAHGRYLYSSAAHAVWLAAGPGVPAGGRIDGVASQVDVLPTLLRLAGVDRPYAGEGLDLADAFRAGSGRTGRERAFVDTWFRGHDRAAVYTDARACMEELSGPYAGRVPTGRFEPGCYARAEDPLHERPLPLDPAHSAALRRWRRDALGATAAPVDVPAVVTEQLEALGYVGD